MGNQQIFSHEKLEQLNVFVWNIILTIMYVLNHVIYMLKTTFVK